MAIILNKLPTAVANDVRYREFVTYAPTENTEQTRNRRNGVVVVISGRKRHLGGAGTWLADNRMNKRMKV